MAMTGLRLRAAREEDREAVLAFCKETWGWGDYIHYVWDEWLADTQGVLRVGTWGDDPTPIALAHCTMLAPGEMWLEGLRVDPALRGKGIARDFTVANVEASRLLGARVTRLATRATNTPMHRVMEYCGFRKVAEFLPVIGKALPGEARSPVVGMERDAARVWAWVQNSAIWHAGQQLLWDSWRCYEMRHELVETLARSGHILVVEAMGQLQGIALLDPNPMEEGVRKVLYLDGTREAVDVLARTLRAMAAEGEVGQVELGVPGALGPVLLACGYVEHDEVAFWVYETE